MDKKKIIFIVFGLIILIIPIYLMMASEDILANGHRHKIRLNGGDPFDPFRGKYLRINIDRNIDCELCEEGEEIFVVLEQDSLGYSYFSKGLKEKPDHDDYFMAKIDHRWGDWVGIKTNNFSKYFINEDKALDAEDILREYQRNRPDDIYLAIRVLDGEARLEDIYIEETPLLDFIDER